MTEVQCAAYRASDVQLAALRVKTAEQELAALRVKAAEQEVAAAHLFFGYVNAEAEDAAFGWTQAVATARKAAEQGDENNQLKLAWLFSPLCDPQDDAPAIDNAQALAWYRLAAEKGY